MATEMMLVCVRDTVGSKNMFAIQALIDKSLIM